MVQFQVLSGQMAGTRTVARRFPFYLGREATANLKLDDPGVWDRHARLEFKPALGFLLTALDEALLTVNSQPIRETLLRNGDCIGLGSVQLRFWLAEVRQRRLAPRELLVWSCVVLVTLGQMALLYWLLR